MLLDTDYVVVLRHWEEPANTRLHAFLTRNPEGRLVWEKDEDAAARFPGEEAARAALGDPTIFRRTDPWIEVRHARPDPWYLTWEKGEARPPRWSTDEHPWSFQGYDPDTQPVFEGTLRDNTAEARERLAAHLTTRHGSPVTVEANDVGARGTTNAHGHRL